MDWIIVEDEEKYLLTKQGGILKCYVVGVCPSGVKHWVSHENIQIEQYSGLDLLLKQLDWKDGDPEAP